MTESDHSSHLSEEPRPERGAPGSRDKGGPPDSGPAGRPAGDPHTKATGVDHQGTVDEEMVEQPPS
jgi:hypothetical protein